MKVVVLKRPRLQPPSTSLDRREANMAKLGTHDGGKPEKKDLPYDPPVGPTTQTRQGPGLGGTNHGKSGTQGKR